MFPGQYLFSVTGIHLPIRLSKVCNLLYVSERLWQVSSSFIESVKLITLWLFVKNTGKEKLLL